MSTYAYFSNLNHLPSTLNTSPNEAFFQVCHFHIEIREKHHITEVLKKKDEYHQHMLFPIFSQSFMHKVT